ncbi:SGNH/GDSL hydrolase family protein [Emticicia agri]|uniref:SGNH/GDSL hydrolase family protein n=1 Tax=Emticicia agri TaxID=2492393 RepID=A0A4V1ZD18_9BACT|nr:SGNH/GDSL hydrolase family protein [Emticicia agri]RYU94610.1 hypothetical protein EWM59_15875 [Emticicia agri]
MKNNCLLLIALSTSVFACKDKMDIKEIPPVVINPVPIDSVANAIEKDKSLYALQPFATGDTITRPVKPDIHFNWETSTDLTPLSDKPKEAFNYTAIGGGLTAGWRDGGLYRQGQQTAYPNLIAHQMGLVNFKTPLFSAEKGNGTGYKVYNKAKVTWDYVGNNTAIEQKFPLKLEKYVGDANNLGMPKMIISESNYFSSIAKGKDIYYNNKKYMVFLERFAKTSKEEDISYKKLFFKSDKKPDFFSVEIGIEDLVTAYLNGQPNSIHDATLQDILVDYNGLFNSGAKGVLCTVPDMLETPYFNIFKLIEEQLKTVWYIDKWGSVQRQATRVKLLPVERLKNMLLITEYGTFASSLYINDVVMDDNIYRRDLLNRRLRQMAEEKNFALVDLEALYAKILKGNYVTDDGFVVSGKFPEGNFFSQDGIYPSAIGQAIIANEFIKAINKTYKTKIPLINLTEYSKKVF